ncbi:hypothetical protein [Mycolicibacterium sp. CH28]|uniref:hypothetical protein n=1 Tax=Mycolicibacterium sp. CH28 TaxID=2512237 RepID=UPI001386FA1D|nr:hypothetical protein [Mycolicibacterium sp. CH28]
MIDRTLALLVVGPDGTTTTHHLRAGSWSGSGYRAAVEVDGTRYLIHVDTTRTGPFTK